MKWACVGAMPSCVSGFIRFLLLPIAQVTWGNAAHGGDASFVQKELQERCQHN